MTFLSEVGSYCGGITLTIATDFRKKSSYNNTFFVFVF